MRFFEFFFLFSPSLPFQHLGQHHIINGASHWEFKRNFNLNHQAGLPLDEPFIRHRAPRNDEIKDIFDIPAALLCAEFYKKHYGFGFNIKGINLNAIVRGLY